jgi:sulfur-carrier protein
MLLLKINIMRMINENKETTRLVELHIISFGQIAELLGESMTISAPISDVASLRNYLIEQNPPLGDMTFSIAVGQRIVGPTFPVDSNQEIALLPPFSGG